MNDISALHTQGPTPARRGDVVLVTHADTDRGYRLACRFLADGLRVVVVARHAASLTRILAGHNAAEVMAIAANVDDEGQFATVLSRAEARLGCVTTIADGRGSGMPAARSHRGALQDALDASSECRTRFPVSA
jgi:NADP-dependent 3-hydroxy acid dehydrogenase YdfG